MKTKFERVSLLPPYVFSEINNIKAKERLKGRDIIDLGMGNPDKPTPKHVVNKLISTIKNPKTHRYSISRGIEGLRKAQREYYRRRFSVNLDKDKEIVVTLGSKEGLANLASAITSKGDLVLVPNPSYPIHPYGFLIAGASVKSIKMECQESFLKNLSLKIKQFKNKIKAIIINYPNNPTTDVVSLDFYKELVRICYKNEIWILSDLAYAEIYFDISPPPSILQINHAKKIAVEFSSMSKTFNMPGWRIGFACGNKVLISALSRIKSYLDYGAFTPIQVAATAALNGPEDCIKEIRSVYKKRRDILISSFKRAGWSISPPNATMFAWAPIPDNYVDKGSLFFSKVLLKKAGVAVSPGIGFGKYGDKHVRISLVENEHRIRQAAKSIKNNLKL
ncbi:aminotransferase class I/II-fold pyridoxal phosphate-dependent enzyme [Alphaproteobacteria bacterium]|nr:aminotransferase class I/II-fold pyridoxal phosphate-dependent enzyme [Alphaproteobacteria bacterium]